MNDSDAEWFGAIEYMHATSGVFTRQRMLRCGNPASGCQRSVPTARSELGVLGGCQVPAWNIAARVRSVPLSVILTRSCAFYDINRCQYACRVPALLTSLDLLAWLLPIAQGRSGLHDAP